jgi:hypothetical protein
MSGKSYLGMTGKGIRQNQPGCILSEMDESWLAGEGLDGNVFCTKSAKMLNRYSAMYWEVQRTMTPTLMRTICEQWKKGHCGSMRPKLGVIHLRRHGGHGWL